MKILLAIGILLSGFTLAQWGSYEVSIPEGWPAPVHDFEANPLDSVTVELGRALFYDPILSRDNTVSCASCHSPFNAFAHTDHKLSHGIGDSIGTRNAPALFNLAWQRDFMWDGAAHSLDAQALGPIEHVGEMDSDLASIVERLRGDSKYVAGFGAAGKDLTGANVLKALSQFQLTLISANSKYDRVKAKKDSFSVQESKGYALFVQHCNSCHAEPLFTNGAFASNGLPVDKKLQDVGRYAVTLRKEDSLQFKVPTLRNLRSTFPYMHDGRFKSIGEVLKHYNQGVVNASTTTTQLREGVNMDGRERTDLLAFLLTLNDDRFPFEEKHQYPRSFFRPVLRNAIPRNK